MTNIGLKERRVDQVTILEVDGQARIGLRFGSSRVPLPKAIQALLEVGQNQILLDLAGVNHFDANGLGELVSSFITVNESGGQIKLVHLTASVNQLMDNNKLLAVFDTYASETEALASFNDKADAAATTKF